MTLLGAYMGRTGTTARVLAKRAGLSEPMVTQIKLGKRRPSPETAKRIEAATAGEVSAVALLGLASDQGWVRCEKEGKWIAMAGEGGLHLPPELLEEFGVRPNTRLVIKRDQDGLRIVDMRQVGDRVRSELRQFIPEDVSLVDDLLAERRAEAARE